VRVLRGIFWAILIAIEAEECCRQHGLASSSKQGNKGSRELSNLECSINYDSKGECSSRGKGRSFWRSYVFLVSLKKGGH
jgi:hypothetical protein